jgi:hypothetical protein
MKVMSGVNYLGWGTKVINPQRIRYTQLSVGSRQKSYYYRKLGVGNYRGAVALCRAGNTKVGCGQLISGYC